MAAPPILVSGLNHAYGKGELRKQILFDVGVEITDQIAVTTIENIVAFGEGRDSGNLL